MAFNASQQSPLNAFAQRMHLSPTLEINELVAQQRAKGRHVIHLGFGEATFPMQRDVAKKYREASLKTSYLPVAGLQRLRESIARFQTRRLGRDIKPEQVVIAPGSKPLLFALFDVLRGDVLLPRPCWVSYEPQILHANKKLFWVETDESDRHSISESALRTAYDNAIQEGADPRIMLINSPSNPTGQVFSKETLKMIASFCRERGIVLISDEIYSDICFEGQDLSISAGSIGDFNNEKIIITGGLSKTYSAGGWRIGFAIFPTNSFGTTVQKAILAYASECWSAAPSPAQEAAALAFEPNGKMDLYRSQVVRLHRFCTLRLYAALKSFGVAVHEPKGGFYVYPSFYPYTAQLLKLGITNSVELARWLIEECGIAALPGKAFGEDDEGGLHGGRFRLRMATSYLYFHDEEERYQIGYDLLETETDLEGGTRLPLLEEAIVAIGKAVEKIKEV